MPYIHVTAPEGALSPDDQKAFMSRLSDAVLRAERAPIDDPSARALVWAYYQEQPTEQIYIGGENLSRPPFCIAVTTPEGALNAVSRQELAMEVGLIVDDIATNRKILSLQAQSWGMVPVETAYPRQALDWIKAGELFDVAILDMQKISLSLFTHGGEFIRSIGREGSGPGEFRMPVAFAFRPEGGLIVSDGMGSKLVFFDENYDLLTETAPFIPSPPAQIVPIDGMEIIGMKPDFEQNVQPKGQPLENKIPVEGSR